MKKKRVCHLFSPESQKIRKKVSVIYFRSNHKKNRKKTEKKYLAKTCIGQSFPRADENMSQGRHFQSSLRNRIELREPSNITAVYYRAT